MLAPAKELGLINALLLAFRLRWLVDQNDDAVDASHHAIKMRGGRFGAEAARDLALPPMVPWKGNIELLALIDCVDNKLYFLGPGPVELTLPPGSVAHQLEMSPSGHLILPVSHFDISPNQYSGNGIGGKSTCKPRQAVAGF